MFLWILVFKEKTCMPHSVNFHFHISIFGNLFKFLQVNVSISWTSISIKGYVLSLTSFAFHCFRVVLIPVVNIWDIVVFTTDLVYIVKFCHVLVCINLLQDDFSLKSDSQSPQGCPRGVLVKAMDCGIVVREFVLQSRYYVHFWANTLGKGLNPLIFLQLWVNSRADEVLQPWLGN